MNNYKWIGSEKMSTTVPIGKHRSLFLVILLGGLTLGIYPFYWMYQTTKELTEHTQSYLLSPGWSIFFTIITFGLYSLYWWYKMNELLMEAQYEAGYSYIKDNKFLLLLLAFFGLAWVNRALLQSELNQLWQVNKEKRQDKTKFEEDDQWTDF